MIGNANIEQVLSQLETGLRAAPERSRASVFIPLVRGENDVEILFEVRAAHLKRQPGEVCLPGGHIEPGESARDAAIRETCEELLVDRCQIANVVDMGRIDGPGGMPLRVFAGELVGYAGSFDAEEVGSVFTVSLDWFLEHEPAVYTGRLELQAPDNLPWDLIPGGRAYPWHTRRHEIPFYEDINPVIWGFTARVVRWFVNVLKAGYSAEDASGA